MKTSTITILAIPLTTASFACSYFMELTMGNAEQYLALIAVVFVDAFFGIMAGIKREGFQTRKAVRVIKRCITWILLLTVILMVEKGFTGTGWLSEAIIVPFIILQLISALKNASMAGLIKMEELNKILDRIDNHKGVRK
jgi:phage-related holin|tara:strand:- start:443 stop:862 length:420 start_codon:yes stop_codon:yes gene_type:complete